MPPQQSPQTSPRPPTKPADDPQASSASEATSNREGNGEDGVSGNSFPDDGTSFLVADPSPEQSQQTESTPEENESEDNGLRSRDTFIGPAMYIRVSSPHYLVRPKLIFGKCIGRDSTNSSLYLFLWFNPRGSEADTLCGQCACWLILHSACIA